LFLNRRALTRNAAVGLSGKSPDHQVPRRHTFRTVSLLTASHREGLKMDRGKILIARKIPVTLAATAGILAVGLLAAPPK
jgi:hypothetical protein